MKYPRSFLSGFVYGISLSVMLLLPACALEHQPDRSRDLQTVTVGVDGTAVNGLIYLADHKQYFQDNGLNLATKKYSSGLAAVEGMLAGEVDAAVASEIVLVGKAFHGDPVITWASIDKLQHSYLMARKDRGIQDPADLRGKKIGLPLKTAAEFYLGRFLDLNGLSLDLVTPVNMTIREAAAALENGEVDAVVVWQPSAKEIEDRLGELVIRWLVQSEQITYGNIISRSDWTERNPQIIHQFLTALLAAETLYAANPQEARDILQEYLQYDDALMDVIWQEHQYQVSLDQSMVLAMEDEARWMIANRLVEASQPPDFKLHIYTEGLVSVRPAAVNVIR